MKARELGTQKLVFGVGINDADYVTRKRETIEVDGKQKQKLVWYCPYYRVWYNMLQRCYSLKYQERFPTYIGCSVSEEWLRFSNFRAWMTVQDWEGKQLDKDLLFEGNKVYSKEACVFVAQTVNKFAIDCGAARGEWLIGVYRGKGVGKFKSSCRNPLTEKLEHLGYFKGELEAHKAWLKRKLELAHLLAAEQTDERVSKALISRYESYN